MLPFVVYYPKCFLIYRLTTVLGGSQEKWTSVINLILKMKKLRHKKVTKLPKDHIVAELGLELSFSDSESWVNSPVVH